MRQFQATVRSRIAAALRELSARPGAEGLYFSAGSIAARAGVSLPTAREHLKALGKLSLYSSKLKRTGKDGREEYGYRYNGSSTDDD